MCGHPIKKEKKKKSIYIERERESWVQVKIGRAHV